MYASVINKFIPVPAFRENLHDVDGSFLTLQLKEASLQSR